MAEFSDPPPSILWGSPKLAKPNKTLDGSSPTAPIRHLVAHSLSISSPIRQIQASSPAKPDGSSSSPSNKTLMTPPQENKCSDSQIIEPTQNSPANNYGLLKITSTSDSYLYSRPENRTPRRYIANIDCQSDDDDFNKIEPTKPLLFSWWCDWYPEIEPTGVGAGLFNSGNTCFIASVLQCFTHTVPLIKSLLSYMHQKPCNCGNEKFCVMQALRNHIELAMRSSGYGLNIDIFRDNLNYFSSDFEINQQEDAQEFLQSFLNKLERCCLDPWSISSQDLNIADNVFGGRLMSTLRCCKCNSVSNTFEPSLGWSLEIEDVDNLWDALESFTRVETLEDQLTCDNCKEKVTKEKQLKLDKLPPIATFHLKRFKNDGFTMEKITNYVDIPFELDLLPYMSSNQNSEVSAKYHLYAFVEHIGITANFGHYSSYVRSAPETWHNFDDEKVTRISEERVPLQNAYILFYAREGTPWFSSTFEQLKTVFEASPFIISPKSVLDHSYQSVGYSNNDLVGVSIPDVLSEVFHSAESSNDEDSCDTLQSSEAHESEKEFAETSQQTEPESCPDEDFCHTLQSSEAHESEKEFAETSQQTEPESCPDEDSCDTLQSSEAPESEKEFAETSQQTETESCPDDSSGMIDTLKSPEAHESEKPFAETSQQTEPESCPADNKANIRGLGGSPIKKRKIRR